MTDIVTSTSSLKKALTRRYCVALTLVFFVLAATFAVFSTQAHIAENDAYLINTSGMQRMLSQRVALMAKEIRYAKTQTQADQFADQLEKSLIRMAQNHRALATGVLANGKVYVLSSDIKDLYLGETNLDYRVNAYLKAGHAFLDLYRDQGLAVVKAAARLEGNVGEARFGLLSDLDRAVAQYEKEAKERIVSFKRLEAAFFGIGLAILIAEVLFIFRPMVRMILRNAQKLEMRNAQLREFSEHLAQQQRRSAKAAARAAHSSTAQTTS